MIAPIGVCPILFQIGSAVKDAAEEFPETYAISSCVPTFEYTLDCEAIERERLAYVTGEVCRIAIAEGCYAAEAAARVAIIELHYRNSASHGADALSEAIWYLALRGLGPEWFMELIGALSVAATIRTRVFENIEE